jgi:hypothetical protein
VSLFGCVVALALIAPADGDPAAFTPLALRRAAPTLADVATERRPARVARQETGVIRGVVLDAPGGTGVGRVSVRLQSTGRTVLTDDRGRFELDEVPPGAHELYVSAVDFILVKRTVNVTAASTADVTLLLSEGTGTYAETVDVRAGAANGGGLRRDPAVAAEQTLASRELQQLRGILTNDPLRAVQVLPAVAAGDDFRSEFAIRGAGVQSMTFTFEGISTPFLLHTVHEVQDSGSVAMVNGDVLEEISLLNGAYPQRHGNRIGAEIDFRMREGSRERVQSHLSVSAIDASAVVEGPLGSRARGSWLLSARKSYLDLIVDRLYPEQNVSFAFTDAQAKFSYDVTRRHQLQAAFTGGRSRLERKPELIGRGNLRTADNRSALGVLTWRFVPSARLSLVQRVAAGMNTFRNMSRDGEELNAGDGADGVYRTDLALAARPGILVEAGGEARWSHGVARERRLSNGRFQPRQDYDGTRIASSIYAQARLGSASGVSITPGARVDRWTLVPRTTVSPWMQLLWPLSRAVTLRAGGGVHRQEPDFGQLLGTHGTAGLRPARAYHADAGVEGRIGDSTRWQMTIYDREDRDLFRLPGTELRVVNRVFLNESISTRYRNALNGYARGVEWLVQRQSPNGFSGWASYALGYAKYRDVTSGETFWSDYDQRHTVNLYGTYRVSDRFSISARFRLGSNFPATGYWDQQDGVHYAGAERNTLRVPAYARADVRANRAFTWDRTRLTLFVEAINVANRANARFAQPSVNRQTFVATGLYENMVPLIPAIGMLLEF